MPTREVGPVTRADIVRFAGASGDFNPLHFDDDSARSVGFDGVIAMGQYQAGVLAAAVSDWVGAESVTAFSVRFRRPVRLGDVLRTEGRVARRDGDEAHLELSVSVGDTIVITGSASFRVVDATD